MCQLWVRLLLPPQVLLSSHMGSGLTREADAAPDAAGQAQVDTVCKYIT